MSFESLSHSFDFPLPDFPERWLPLTYLYDPDLPLFPLLYFHVLDPRLPQGQRAGETDRAYGYVQSVNKTPSGFTASVCLNKNLHLQNNDSFRTAVGEVVRQRLGLGSPVTLQDVTNPFTGKLAEANNLVKELWYRTVDRSFGKTLPFGEMWDATLGLARYVASWNSPSGRKGEIIQTHGFASSFGEAIQSGSGYNVDFYLLPTFQELTDTNNPLSLFPKFRLLVDAAGHFCSSYCSIAIVSSVASFSAFQFKKHAGVSIRLDSEWIRLMAEQAPQKLRQTLYDNFGVFNRGPQRSCIFLMMLNDLRKRLWQPTTFGIAEAKGSYTLLDKTYQSPKVIHLYSQQCFANSVVLPLDMWIRTFLAHPFRFRPSAKKDEDAEVFDCCTNWGKVERLIWVAAQGRKVHSSSCADILWCVRFGDAEKKMRGANPLGCKLCANVIREQCPAFAHIAKSLVSFNNESIGTVETVYNIKTSAGTNGTTGQTLLSCEGPDACDTYSVHDMPSSFAPFPVAGHDGSPLSVSQFIEMY